jgi:hypothetical protein
MRPTEARLEALREREQKLKQAIAAELLREQKRKAREHERLVGIIGQAILDEATRSTNFKLMLKQTLNSAVVDEKSRQLLSNLGWI